MEEAVEERPRSEEACGVGASRGPWEDAYLTPERVARASWRRPHARASALRGPRGLRMCGVRPDRQLPTWGNLNRRFLCKMVLPEGSRATGDSATQKGMDPTLGETFF